ncbi:unnamed protein product [Closterium sp. NIES-65]|nr:unnamed protein product [Closterium sp. NIES-65]
MAGGRSGHGENALAAAGRHVAGVGKHVEGACRAMWVEVSNHGQKREYQLVGGGGGLIEGQIVPDTRSIPDRLIAAFKDKFFPMGYPDSVAEGYMLFSQYRGIQHIAVAALNVLSTQVSGSPTRHPHRIPPPPFHPSPPPTTHQSLFFAAGLRPTPAHATTVSWVVKDGMQRSSGIIVARDPCDLPFNPHTPLPPSHHTSVPLIRSLSPPHASAGHHSELGGEGRDAALHWEHNQTSLSPLSFLPPTHQSLLFAAGLRPTPAQTTILSWVSLLFAAGLRPTPAQATIVSWVVKDGMQHASKIAASRLGRSMDADPKRWRVAADVVCDVGAFLECLSPLMPHRFLLLAGLANAGKVSDRGRVLMDSMLNGMLS